MSNSPEVLRAEAVARLREYIRDGRVIRYQWETQEEVAGGRHLACLYVALAGRGERPESCPAWLMPEWMAHLTPWIDDRVSDSAWPGIISRYAELIERGVPDRLKWVVRRVAVEEAVRHTERPRLIAACGDVVVLCRRAEAGDVPSDREWDDVWVPAEDTAGAAAWTAAEALQRDQAAAAGAARAAVWAAERAAAKNVARAARAAGAVVSHAEESAAKAAASAEAADRMTLAIMDAWETMLDEGGES